MNKLYQSNYGGATAMVMHMEHSFFPGSLEQKLYDNASNILQKGRDYWTDVKSAFDTVGYYQNIIMECLADKGTILFSKRRRQQERQNNEAERQKRRAAKQQRMKNPSGGSRYAKKRGE